MARHRPAPFFRRAFHAIIFFNLSHKWVNTLEDLHILIVDDDLVTQKLLLRYLAPFGKCKVVSDGRSAIAAYETAWAEDNPFSLVCLDILLPEADGQEVLASLRRIERKATERGKRKTYVAMITAMGDMRNISKAYRHRCDAYLVKPVSQKKLHQVLEKLFGPEILQRDLGSSDGS